MTNTQPPTQEDDKTLIAAMADLEGWLRNVKDLPANAEVVARGAQRLQYLALFSPPAGVVEALRLLLNALDREAMATASWEMVEADPEAFSSYEQLDRQNEMGAALINLAVAEDTARQALSALEGMGKQGLSSSREPSSTADAACEPKGSALVTEQVKP